MTEVEFWASTYARVMALYEVQVNDWHQTRDYFIAYVASLYFGAHTPEGQTAPTSEEILASHYRPRKRRVTITHDPDHGAMGDWQALKSHLKGTTTVAKQRRAKLKPHAPKP